MIHHKTPSNALSYLSSNVIEAMEWCSASVEDRDTVCCFLVFQDIGEPPRETSQLMSKWQVKGQLAQYESHQLDRERSQLEQ